MSKFRFVHTAGLHLNAPFTGVGRVPSKVRDALAAAAVGAWDDLVAACIAKDVKFIVIAGGIESVDTPGLGGRLRLAAGLRKLVENNVECFLILGKDDPVEAAQVIDSGSDAITVFPANQPISVEVSDAGKIVGVVCGQSAPPEGEVRYNDFFSECADNVPRIGVIPGSLESLEHAIENGAPRASYWALGDAPAPSRRGFSPWIVESGALQSRSAAAEQRGPRGATLVEVEGDRIIAVDHMAADRVRYEEITLTPRFAADEALLTHQIMDDLNRLRATHSGRALLVDIVLTETGVQSPRPITPAQTRVLLERVREQTASWDPFVWCSSLRLPSEPAAEPIGDPIAQAIVQGSRALLSNPLQRSYFFARRFEPLMRRWTSEFDTGDAERLIADATTLALQNSADAAPTGE